MNIYVFIHVYILTHTHIVILTKHIGKSTKLGVRGTGLYSWWQIKVWYSIYYKGPRLEGVHLIQLFI